MRRMTSSPLSSLPWDVARCLSVQQFLSRSSHLSPSQGIDSANSTATLHPKPVHHLGIQPRPLPSSVSSSRPLPWTSPMMHTRPGLSLPSNNMLVRPTTPSPRASKHPGPSRLPWPDSRTSKLLSMPHLTWCLLHLMCYFPGQSYLHSENRASK